MNKPTDLWNLRQMITLLRDNIEARLTALQNQSMINARNWKDGQKYDIAITSEVKW